MMKIKVSAGALKELLHEIESFPGPLDRMKDDHRLMSRISNIQKIIG